MPVPSRDFLIEICDDPSMFSSTRPGGVEPRTIGRTRIHHYSDNTILVADDLIVVASLRFNQSGMKGGRSGQNDMERLAGLVRIAGEDVVDHLDGDYSLVAVWPHRIVAARDHMGVRPLYYAARDGRIAFTTRSALLRGLDWVRFEVDPVRAGDYLLSLFEERDSTLFREVRRLAAGSVMVVDPQSTRIRRYWDPGSIQQARADSDEAYIQCFRDVLVSTVRDRVDPSARIGTTLSGGLDSSSVAGIARTIMGSGELHSFSGLFEQSRRSDERSHIAAVVAMGGIVSHEIRLDDIAPLQSFGDVRTIFDEPFFAPNLFLHAAVMRSAQEAGCAALLDGLDGDTAVSHGLGRLLELARGFHLPTLLHELRALSSGIMATTPGRLLWRSIVRPLVLRRPRLLLRAIRRAPESPWGDTAFINRDFARHLELPKRYLELTAARGHPVRTQREEHVRRITWPLHQYMLEILFRLGSYIGIESRYPFYDRRLIETAISLPASMKLRDGWTRYVLRKGIEEFVPQEIAWRVSKADLGDNFNRTFRRLELPVVRALVEQGNNSVWNYADRSRAARGVDLVEKGENWPIMPLWNIHSLSPWID